MTSILAVVLTTIGVQPRDDIAAQVSELIERLAEEGSTYQAVQSLLEIGSVAVPQLVHAHRHSKADHRVVTFLVLLRIGPEAVPPLVAALQNGDTEARCDAAFGLGFLAKHALKAGLRTGGPYDESPTAALREALRNQAVPVLTSALADKDARVQATALDAIASIGPDAFEALPRLMDFLQDEHSELGDEAIVAVGQLGPACRSTVERLLKNRNQVVRERGAATLDSIRMAELVSHLADQQRWREAARDLAEIGPEAVPLLLQARAEEWMPFSEGRGEPVAATNWIFDEMGARAVPALILGLQVQDPAIRAEAASSLGSLGMGLRRGGAALDIALEERAVPALVDARRDEDARVRMLATSALGNLGPTAAAALPVLLEALRDPDSLGIGVHLDYAIGSIGAAAVPGLVEALADDHDLVRRRAVSALGAIGPDASDAIPALLQALTSADEGDRFSIGLALREIGYKKEVSSYVTDLKSASLLVSSDAVKALGELGPEATEALPALIDLIRDRGSLLRRDAVIALSKIGPRGSEAVAPLVQALSGEDDVTIIPYLVIA